jgi:lipid-A-disaccharide synthase-like uncharacterized protein
VAQAADGDTTPTDDRARVEISLPGVERVELARRAVDGTYVYRVRYQDGHTESLRPDDFAAAMDRLQTSRPWWHRLLNVGSAVGIAWVALGLLGQVLFAGRMLVQWIASEKERRSVVPVAFWWMSLAGATILLVYFVWREDPVGIVGQATGWLIYARNLILIRRGTEPASRA